MTTAQDITSLDNAALVAYYEQACEQTVLMLNAKIDITDIDALVDDIVAEMQTRNLA